MTASSARTRHPLAIGVLIAIGVLLIAIAGCSPSVPPSATPAPGTASLAPSSSPSASSSPLPSPSSVPTPGPTSSPEPVETTAHLRWTKTRTNLPAGVVATGVTALAMRPGNPPTYVAISADHRVWLSRDGTTWRKGDGMPGATGGNIWWVRHLFVDDGSFVAFGQSAILEDDGTDGPYSGIISGFVWTSKDGEAWRRTQLDGFSATSVVLDGGEFVATGGLDGQYAPTFATSPDGMSWTKVPVAGDPWPAQQGRSPWPTFGALVGSRTVGYTLLVRPYPYSDVDCAGVGPTPIAWHSADLRAWQPAMTLASGCAMPQFLVAGPAGHVALRQTFLQDTDVCPVQAWRSTDGVQWTEVPQPPGPLTFLASVGVAPDGTFLAFGNGIWESVDGDHWALSAPAKGLNVEQFAGDLAIACGDDACYSLRLRNGD